MTQHYCWSKIYFNWIRKFC